MSEYLPGMSGTEYLITGIEQGFYMPDDPSADQTPIPWAEKRCGNCPWFNRADPVEGFCVIKFEQRNAFQHTCEYFDPERHEAAQKIAQENMSRARRQQFGME